MLESNLNVDKTLSFRHKRRIVLGISSRKRSTAEDFPLLAGASGITHNHRLRIPGVRERRATEIFGLVRCLEELETRARVVSDCGRVPGTQGEEKMRHRQRQLFQTDVDSVMAFTVDVIHDIARMPN